MPDNKRARRARAGVRSFQPSAAGKGDASRITDVEAFRRNYDEINWGRPATPTTASEYCDYCGGIGFLSNDSYDIFTCPWCGGSGDFTFRDNQPILTHEQ